MLPRRAGFALYAAALVISAAGHAHAHSRTATFGDVAFVGGDVVWTLRVRAEELHAGLGLPEGTGADAVLARGADAAAYVARGLSVADRDGGGGCRQRAEPASRETAAPEPTLRFVVRFTCPGTALRLRYDLFFDVDDLHSGFTTIAVDADHRTTVIFRRDLREFVIARAHSLVGELRSYLVLGIEHIFTGYDHLAFLAALLLGTTLVRRRGEVPHPTPTRAAVAATVRIVTAFTAAHSLTLVLAALRPELVPTAWVEPTIALSVSWVAIGTLWARPGRRGWPVAFVFGLVHGFGFASVLAEIGLPSRGLVACLLAFNVGVELGQLAVVSVALPLLLALARRAPRAFERIGVVGGSLTLAAAGAIWFVLRVW